VQNREFVHIRVEDLLLDDDPPQIHIVHAKRGADRYVPGLAGACERTAYASRRASNGFLFESNRHTRYATRTVQSIGGCLLAFLDCDSEYIFSERLVNSCP
jgi:integrase/recombinase XerD